MPRRTALAIALVALASTVQGQALAAQPPAPQASVHPSPFVADGTARPPWPVERLVYRANGAAPRADTWSPSLSSDGHTLAFVSYDRKTADTDLEGRWRAGQVYLRDLTTGVNTLLSVSRKGTRVGNRDSSAASMSADGSAVAFWSYATNLVRADDNGHSDVFVRDLVTAKTTLVSASLDGSPGDGASEEVAISADGTKVVFTSFADDLTDAPSSPWEDVYLRDLTTGTTTLVSRGLDGAEPDFYSYTPDISADGSVVVFTSWASNLVEGDDNDTADIFAYEVATGALTRVSHAFDGGESDDLSVGPIISGDGNRVAFVSRADNLVERPEDEILQVFVTDRGTGETFAFDGGFEHAVNEGSSPSDLSYDGSVLAFVTSLTNVNWGDRNSWDDVYLADVASGRLALVSHTPANRAGNYYSGSASMSVSAETIVFATGADDIVVDDTNDAYDIMVSRSPTL